MQLFSYNPHPFLSKTFFKLFLTYFCLNNMICYFPSHVSCFILLIACSQFRSMFFHACLYVIYFDLHVLCFMSCFLCLDVLFPIFFMLDPHASISHTVCLCLDLSFSCVVWLDPHVSMLVYMSICLSYMLYALCHVQIILSYVLMFGSTCSHA